MKTTNQTINRTFVLKAIASMSVLALLIGILSLPMLAHNYPGTPAQDEHKMHHDNSTGKDVIIGKKGVLHFTNVVKVGELALQPGMYQVQHVTEGGDDLIIFREIQMGYRANMGNEQLGKEVAKVECRVEPVTNKWKDTKLIMRTNAAGEKEVGEIQIDGEAVKHMV